MADTSTGIIHHWQGRNYKTVWTLDNDKQAIDIMSLDMNAVGTKVADGVSGEQRTRNFFVLDHYEIKAEIQQTKLEALRAVLKWQDTSDAFATPLVSTVGLVITFNDATEGIVVIREISIDDWSFALPGRADRNKFTLPMRANVFKIL
jgi:hypothetical protein